MCKVQSGEDMAYCLLPFCTCVVCTLYVQYVKYTLPLLQVFVSSGPGGMSGAQPKAATIVGCIAVIAEVNEAALLKRHQQG